MGYLKCGCGSAEFLRVYNVLLEKIKVNVVVEDGEELTLDIANRLFPRKRIS